MGKLEIWPVAVPLYLFSVACVVETLWKHAAFDTEPTLALMFVIGLPWLLLRSWRAHRREQAKAPSVASDVHHQPPRVRP
jgi:hypothetical protein